MSRCGSLRLLTLALLCVLPASSAILTYSDLATWQANATQAGATIDFSNLAPAPGTYSSQYVSLNDYADAAFSSPGDSVQAFNASAAWPWYQWNSGAILRSNAGGLGSGTMRVDLAAPVTAFAALIGINNMDGGNNWIGSQMTVEVRSGATLLASPVVATSAHPTLTFIGLVSTTPGETFDSLTLVPVVNYVFLDDVRLGSYNAPGPPVGETPEPGTAILALCGAGLLALAKARRMLRMRK